MTVSVIVFTWKLLADIFFIILFPFPSLTEKRYSMQMHYDKTFEWLNIHENKRKHSKDSCRRRRSTSANATEPA